MSTLQEDVFTFMTTSRWILPRMRNVSNKSCRENQNACFMFGNFLFRKSHRLWDNVEKFLVESERPQTIWRMRVACWISKATRAKAHALARASTLRRMHAHACVHTHTHTHTHTHLHREICKTFCFSTRLDVTSYAHWPRSLFLITF